jgi:uncharacterized protein YdeI (YjbR/CyaY-like superfamily)
MTHGDLNPKVDAYIEKAKPFAQPILEHIRSLFHKGCPDVEEAIKWSMPFFVYKGAILANMAAFKEHCSCGFWGKEISAAMREAGAAKPGEGMGLLGKITSVKDLPPDKQMLGWIRQAAALVDSGNYTSPMAGRTEKAAKRPQPKASPELAAALKKNKKASAVFENFSPSCQREYIEWIAEAKREETRDKRIAQAVEWIAEGKQRNWKYQNC